MTRSLIIAALCCVVVACGAGRQPPSEPTARSETEVPVATDDYPLQRPSVIARDFLWHQQITASVGGRHVAFQAFVGKEGDTLTVIGLSPVGSSWFELVQRGFDVDYWSMVPHALPLPPRYVLADIHRCYFPVSPDPAPHDGTRSVTLAETEVTEVWRDGQLSERTFRRPGDGADSAVTVRYEPVVAGAIDGRVVVVTNPRFGYVLKISTVDQTPESRTRSDEPMATY